MCKSPAVTTLVFVTLIAVTRSQYFDIFQGLQQFLQPYPQNDFTPQYNGFSRQQSPHRQENKKKVEQRNQERSTKKPPVNQYDYVFATTQKPKRKQSKNNSSQPSSRTFAKQQYSNILFGDYFPTYETTTRRVKAKTTTTEANYYNNNYFNRPTDNSFNNNYNRPTENSFSNNYNRPTENSFNNNFNRPENYENNRNNFGFNNFDNNFNRRPSNNEEINYNNNNNFNNNFNRRPNNNGEINYNNNFNNNNPNRNVNNNNREVINTDYDPNQNNEENPTNFGFSNKVNTANINAGNPIRNNNFGTGIINPISGISPVDYDRPVNSRGGNKFNQGNGDFVYPANNNNYNPLLNRPGVKPVYDFGQPITNKPVNTGFYEPTDVFEKKDAQPEIMLGVDEDEMSEVQKRRYIDLAEKMCDRYKALTVKKVVALPLLPSPEPVELNVTSCTPINVPLIIGGKVVSIKEFPHMALIGWLKTRNTGYSWKCGGSLVSEQYVLTAGHCTFQDRDFDAVSDDTYSGPPHAVQLGSSYLDDPGAVVLRVAEVVRHPKYKMRRSYHDVALLKLAERVSFSEVIRPACLGVPPREGENIIATGWGRTEFGGENSEQLRSVSLPVWNMADCREIWGTSLKLPNGPTADSHVCAGERRGGKDTCQGDSGGPAVIQDGCAWRVLAVTSVGRACGAAGTPALYARVPRVFVAAHAFNT